MEVPEDASNINKQTELINTMGNILSTSTDNKPQESEPTSSQESDILNKDLEVMDTSNVLSTENDKTQTISNTSDATNEKQKTLAVTKNKEDDVEQYTKNLSVHDINLIIMGKPSDVTCTGSPSFATDGTISEAEELWLESAQELSNVKVDNDEDFEVIIKSLETAIVATDSYDNDVILTEDILQQSIPEVSLSLSIPSVSNSENANEQNELVTMFSDAADSSNSELLPKSDSEILENVSELDECINLMNTSEISTSINIEQSEVCISDAPGNIFEPGQSLDEESLDNLDQSSMSEKQDEGLTYEEAVKMDEISERQIQKNDLFEESQADGSLDPVDKLKNIFDIPTSSEECIKKTDNINIENNEAAVLNVIEENVDLIIEETDNETKIKNEKINITKESENQINIKSIEKELKIKEESNLKLEENILNKKIEREENLLSEEIDNTEVIKENDKDLLSKIATENEENIVDKFIKVTEEITTIENILNKEIEREEIIVISTEKDTTKNKINIENKHLEENSTVEEIETSKDVINKEIKSIEENITGEETKIIQENQTVDENISKERKKSIEEITENIKQVEEVIGIEEAKIDEELKKIEENLVSEEIEKTEVIKENDKDVLSKIATENEENIIDKFIKVTEEITTIEEVKEEIKTVDQNEVNEENEIMEQIKLIEEKEVSEENKIMEEESEIMEEIKAVDEKDVNNESKIMTEMKTVEEKEMNEESKVPEEIVTVEEKEVNEESEIMEEIKAVDEKDLNNESKIMAEIKTAEEKKVNEKIETAEEEKVSEENKIMAEIKTVEEKEENKKSKISEEMIINPEKVDKEEIKIKEETKVIKEKIQNEENKVTEEIKISEEKVENVNEIMKDNMEINDEIETIKEIKISEENIDIEKSQILEEKVEDKGNKITEKLKISEETLENKEDKIIEEIICKEKIDSEENKITEELKITEENSEHKENKITEEIRVKDDKVENEESKIAEELKLNDKKPENKEDTFTEVIEIGNKKVGNEEIKITEEIKINEEKVEEEESKNVDELKFVENVANAESKIVEEKIAIKESKIVEEEVANEESHTNEEIKSAEKVANKESEIVDEIKTVEEHLLNKDSDIFEEIKTLEESITIKEGTSHEENININKLEIIEENKNVELEKMVEDTKTTEDSESNKNNKIEESTVVSESSERNENNKIEGSKMISENSESSGNNKIKESQVVEEEAVGKINKIEKIEAIEIRDSVTTQEEHLIVAEKDTEIIKETGKTVESKNTMKENKPTDKKSVIKDATPNLKSAEKEKQTSNETIIPENILSLLDNTNNEKNIKEKVSEQLENVSSTVKEEIASSSKLEQQIAEITATKPKEDSKGKSPQNINVKKNEDIKKIEENKSTKKVEKTEKIVQKPCLEKQKSEEIISLPVKESKKHSLDSEETSSPPKKIKLIRDKSLTRSRIEPEIKIVKPRVVTNVKIIEKKHKTAIAQEIKETVVPEPIKKLDIVETVDIQKTEETDINIVPVSEIKIPEKPVTADETISQEISKVKVIEVEKSLITELSSEGKSKQKLKLTRSYRPPRVVAKKEATPAKLQKTREKIVSDSPIVSKNKEILLEQKVLEKNIEIAKEQNKNLDILKESIKTDDSQKKKEENKINLELKQKINEEQNKNVMISKENLNKEDFDIKNEEKKEESKIVSSKTITDKQINLKKDTKTYLIVIDEKKDAKIKSVTDEHKINKSEVKKTITSSKKKDIEEITENEEKKEESKIVSSKTITDKQINLKKDIKTDLVVSDDKKDTNNKLVTDEHKIDTTEVKKTIISSKKKVIEEITENEEKKEESKIVSSKTITDKQINLKKDTKTDLVVIDEKIDPKIKSVTDEHKIDKTGVKKTIISSKKKVIEEITENEEKKEESKIVSSKTITDKQINFKKDTKIDLAVIDEKIDPKIKSVTDEHKIDKTGVKKTIISSKKKVIEEITDNEEKKEDSKIVSSKTITDKQINLKKDTKTDLAVIDEKKDSKIKLVTDEHKIDKADVKKPIISSKKKVIEEITENEGKEEESKIVSSKTITDKQINLKKDTKTDLVVIDEKKDTKIKLVPDDEHKIDKTKVKKAIISSKKKVIEELTEQPALKKLKTDILIETNLKLKHDKESISTIKLKETDNLTVSSISSDIITEIINIEEGPSTKHIEEKVKSVSENIKSKPSIVTKKDRAEQNVSKIQERKFGLRSPKIKEIPKILSEANIEVESAVKAKNKKEQKSTILSDELKSSTNENKKRIETRSSKPDEIISCDSPKFDQSTNESFLKIVSVCSMSEEDDKSEPYTIIKPLRVEVDLDESLECRSDKLSERNVPKITITRQRASPKIKIKPIVKPTEESTSKQKNSPSDSAPRVIIKPVGKSMDPLKITITKQSDDSHSILKIYKPEEEVLQQTNVPKLTIKPVQKSDETPHSPRITIKNIKQLGSPPSCNLPPNITVKPVMTCEVIQTDMLSPKSRKGSNIEENYPKVTIKPIIRPEETQRPPQLSPRQSLKIKSMAFESSGITMEPIVMTSPPAQRPDTQISPLKISVKPFAKMEETLSPKLTIKPITKTCEIVHSEDGSTNPLKLTIKPISKQEDNYQSPKITIKPVIKPEETPTDDSDKPERIILKIQKTNLPSPKERTSMHIRELKKDPEIRIDPVQESDKNEKLGKIKLKLMKEGGHAQIIPSPLSYEPSGSLKRTLLTVGEAAIIEKRPRTELGPELLHTSDISINLVEPNTKSFPKAVSDEITIVKIDKPSPSTSSVLSRALMTPQQPTESKFKEMLLQIQQKPDITCTPHIVSQESSDSDDVKIVEIIPPQKLKDPLSINEESNSQDVVIVSESINPNAFHDLQFIKTNAPTVPSPLTIDPITPTPKKRGRPRKNPLEVKPEIKGEDCVEVVRPKRTCRGPAGKTPYVVKERKPRGGGRGGRGSRGRGGGPGRTPKPPKEPKSPRGRGKFVKGSNLQRESLTIGALKDYQAQEFQPKNFPATDFTVKDFQVKDFTPKEYPEKDELREEVYVIDQINIDESTEDLPNDTPAAIATSVPTTPPASAPVMKEPEIPTIDSIPAPKPTTPVKDSEKVAKVEETVVTAYEEETRMSADNNNSRAQTPARQFVVPPPSEGPEESQSSVHSSATTESGKTKKGRLEVCDYDSAVTGAEQIAEYSWGCGGPYMLQEQIAQYLGVKSFKRKYPGLSRRPVEMQERDYIREKNLVSESLCDMGLTAVPSSEILDIMYTDFQDKYEEYRKYMRDKQSKEISNKQKAISLATSQEKNKLDFKERAIRSAASWNCNFNKARKDTRRCCMDLQTFTVNFPTGTTQGKMPTAKPVGNYPLALVPGQFTDYYKSYTPPELHYLPLNTVRYGPMIPNSFCPDIGQSDGSQSDSDSSSGSDSDSSDSDSVTIIEDVPQCKPPLTPVNVPNISKVNKVH